MKIENIKINSYGNLKNKEINLQKLNIIYGRNESGKSTLLNFIKNTFYGISKNKNGKNISDYDKYLPWGEKDFSGKIKYSLDNNSKYEVYRDFNKKNPTVYNDQLVDVSNEFKIDKKTGNQFFIEQTNVDENTFMSTAFSMQKEVVVDSSTQGILLQKVANLAESGSEDVSYKKAMSNINSMLLNEVGTSNSKDRPINITQSNINQYTIDLMTINDVKENRYIVEENINNIKKQIEEENKKENLLKLIDEVIANIKIEKEKIKIKNNIIEENNQKIKKLDNEKDNLLNKLNDVENNLNNKIKKNNNKNNNKIIDIIICLILIILNIINIIFIKNNIIKFSILALIPIYIIYLIIKLNKNKKIKIQENEELNKINLEKAEINKQMDILDGQIEILEKNSEETKNEINKSEEELNNKLINEKNNIIEGNKNNFEEDYIDSLFKSNVDLLINTNQRKINDLNLQLHKLEIDRDNIDPKLEKLTHTEELLEIEQENLKKLQNRAEELNLAKVILDEAYTEMKKNITPKFNQSLSKNIEKISDGKYKNIIINDQITVELDDGRYVPAESLSIGTVEQIYLSLRLAIMNEISKEKLPVMLDEAFAYYDDQRLEAALDFLNKIDNQVILFTCTNREKEILEKNNIDFNFVSL